MGDPKAKPRENQRGEAQVANPEGISRRENQRGDAPVGTLFFLKRPIFSE